MAPMFLHPVRLITRLLAFGCFVLRASCSYLKLWIQGAVTPENRQLWMQRSAQQLCQVLHLHTKVHGGLPANGLVACNHLGYLDIVALASVIPGIFVSKSDVRYWPIIGFLSSWAGTIYVNRRKKSDVARVSKEIAAHLEKARRVIVFPEGTSTNGSQVLPFHSSLFSPAAATKQATTPCYLSYSEPGNQPGQTVCYWGDMLFLTHFLKLLTLDSIEAKISFAPPIPPGNSRKDLANLCFREVMKLSNHNKS